MKLRLEWQRFEIANRKVKKSPFTKSSNLKRKLLRMLFSSLKRRRRNSLTNMMTLFHYSKK